ncbi:L-threonylcarbamoyladenylate synthase [Lactococcus carnosus]|uniref:L-threonylcarbamoyladenylate synthase n=1 Tax=Pseudolactococcus carnosus TaxID=2749961 RepID=UPI0008122453|nr:L-threonylcarbamoyladenylate synthase [Lactococcus carnosus]SCA91557.1 putative translation factor tRNA(NNU) t(6)A37 threonylcarbamoyladenosine modification; threonine-dependent ADP-forming ATPase, ywlC [Lactococcus piscium]MCJ1969760.1 threonylcarbamoyl-AMP synthase [Lactococcus carnosus]MCJ1973781.1 threonylcarbamoyl-AMP synthase [Lactococcus carnosus]MCJ1976242.1 threonylcarbamoyl-AMP synthase [Lactococcus carnosus]MCJ1980627.1 threonylcarbamoyl-AMP synthase [Lactococcus carnosus]
MTELLTSKDVTKAVELLQAGQLVALPTETVYGLFGLALDDTVVEKIYQVKNRQHDHALNLNISSFEQMKYFSQNQPKYLEKLYNKFMPGSLTVILEANKRVPSLVNYGMPTVGFRMPDNQTTLEILRQTGPMVGPSANLTGNPSPKTAQDVLSDLSGQIAAVLKADESISGIDSTIVDLTGELPTILRQGALTLSEIYEVIKDDF